MESVLVSSYFRYLIFPIGSALLGILVKYATRNDQFAKFTKEDVAIGLDLMRTACLMFVLLTSDKAIALLTTNKQLQSVLSGSPIDQVAATNLQTQAATLSSNIAWSGWLVALMFLGLWGVSTLVRKWGWKSPTEMNVIIGIAIPLGFGILTLVGVMAQATR